MEVHCLVHGHDHLADPVHGYDIVKVGDKVMVFGRYQGVVKKIDKHGIQVRWKVGETVYLAYVERQYLK